MILSKDCIIKNNFKRFHFLRLNLNTVNRKLIVPQEADIALTGLTITSQRETAVDFTDLFFRDPTAIVVKAGTMVSNNEDIF